MIKTMLRTRRKFPSGRERPFRGMSVYVIKGF